jgi:hypothetical protein
MVFHRKETNYDLVVGMDVMIALGINVSCSNQTIRYGKLLNFWENILPK